MTVTIVSGEGKCRVCGCTDLNPCFGETEPGAPLEQCFWVTPERNLCSALHCIARVPLGELLEMQEAKRANA